MLMVLLGPLIGQGSAWLHGAGQHHANSQMSMADCGMAGMPAMAHGAKPAKTFQAVDLDACGYCSLLFQHPALGRFDFFLDLPAAPGSTDLVVIRPLRSPAAPFFSSSRSRAPPQWLA